LHNLKRYSITGIITLLSDIFQHKYSILVKLKEQQRKLDYPDKRTFNVTLQFD